MNTDRQFPIWFDAVIYRWFFDHKFHDRSGVPLSKCQGHWVNTSLHSHWLTYVLTNFILVTYFLLSNFRYDLRGLQFSIHLQPVYILWSCRRLGKADLLRAVRRDFPVWMGGHSNLTPVPHTRNHTVGGWESRAECHQVRPVFSSEFWVSSVIDLCMLKLTRFDK